MKYNNFTQVYQKSWSYAILFLRYMVREGFNCYFSFWTIFCPFTALTARKIKVWIKKKKDPEVSPIHTSVPKIMIICYIVPEIYGAWWMELLFLIFGYLLPIWPPNSPKKYMVCDWCNCYFSFWAIFCPFTALTDQKIKISKFQNFF